MLQRSLGHYERFSLARHNMAHSPAVIFSAQLPNDSLNSSNLIDSIRYLLNSEPLLRSSIAFSRTEDPKFRLQEGIEPEKVLVKVESVANSTEEALLRGVQAMVDLDIEQAPLWRVFLYEPDTNKKRRRIVLAVHHTLCDGSAARNLFVELLTLLRQPAIDFSSSPTNSSFPPSLEETIDVRPSKLFVLRNLFPLFIAPRLPSFLYASPTPFWPNPSSVTPFTQPTSLRHFFLPTELSLALSTVSKSHKAKTLQPVFTTVATAAIANVVTTRRRNLDSPGELNIKSQSPISLRSPDLGHPSLTGNYVSSASHPSPSITPSYLSSTRFWSEVRSYSEYLNLPSTRQTAKEGMGLLAYLPSAVEPTLDDRGKPWTGWEKHLRDQMVESKNPWTGGSFEVSNLGRMKDLQKEWEQVGGVEEVCWAQPGSGIGIGLAFNTISSGGVLSCTVTWRKDSIDTETVEEIVKAYETILTRIAKGEIGEDTKLGELI
ncbi:hypothetical protein JCM5350_001870 [Sporobolomyces pararoseus]